MSYEIVRNLSIKQDEHGYYAEIKSASSSLRPLYYETWKYKVREHATKEDVEKCLLYDFWGGNLQKGNSVYRKAVKAISNHTELFARYYKLGHLINIISNKLGSKRYLADKTQLTKREQELCALLKKLNDVQVNEAKDVLYNFLQENRKQLSTTRVKPFVIVLKKNGNVNVDGNYITDVRKYNVTWGYSPKVFTSKTIYDRVTTQKWFKENCLIEQVSQNLMPQ